MLIFCLFVFQIYFLSELPNGLGALSGSTAILVPWGISNYSVKCQMWLQTGKNIIYIYIF